MAVATARLRWETLRRDNRTCWYCGAKAPGVRIVVDAVVPEALGGSHKDPANLAAACEDCNRGKSSTMPDPAMVRAVAQRAAEWAEAAPARDAVDAYAKRLLGEVKAGDVDAAFAAADEEHESQGGAPDPHRPGRAAEAAYQLLGDLIVDRWALTNNLTGILDLATGGATEHVLAAEWAYLQRRGLVVDPGGVNALMAAVWECVAEHHPDYAPDPEPPF